MPQAPQLLDRRHLRRRSALVAQRLRASVTGGLKEPVLFLHLPKCGGTSLAAALCGTVPIQHRIGPIDALATRRAAGVTHAGRDDLITCHEELENGDQTFALRQGLMATHMAMGCRLIHGHVFFSPHVMQTLGQRYRIVTVMRDPVDRALSNYRMAVRAGVVPDDVEAWLSGPVGRRMAQTALRYLSGMNTITDEPAALEQARMALERIDLVGVLEDMPGFQSAFEDRFGVRPVIPRLNTGKGPAVSLTPAQQNRLEALVAPDRSLYASALGRRIALLPARASARTEGSAPVRRTQTSQARP